MKKEFAFKGLAIIGTLVGCIGTCLEAFADRQEEKAYISKEVERQISKKESEEEEDPE